MRGFDLGFFFAFAIRKCFVILIGAMKLRNEEIFL